MNLFKDLPNNLDEEVFEDLLTHKKPAYRTHCLNGANLARQWLVRSRRT